MNPVQNGFHLKVAVHVENKNKNKKMKTRGQETPAYLVYNYTAAKRFPTTANRNEQTRGNSAFFQRLFTTHTK